MIFSGRTPDDLSHNRIAKAQNLVSPCSLLDLTESNPTHCDFDYPEDLLKGLSRSQSLIYEPDPFGNPQARERVAVHLNSKGWQVDKSNILLTASTSEAYSYLFKLLGNPGDTFLVPTPGYPLFDHLARLEGVDLLPYPLKAEPYWPVNLEKAEKAVQPETKGLLVVNPNNPTGTFLSPSDQKALWDLCGKRQLPYISDEVFGDYAYPGYNPGPKIPSDLLSFRLGGLSKSIGLPQLKLSWVAMDGPKDLLDQCRERLELIADTYLSVNTPVQLALKDLLNFAPLFQKQVLNRVLANRTLLEQGLAGLSGVKVWPAQGGWYALVEILKPGASDEEIVIQLLEKHKVLMQPGGFYDFPQGCFLVLSLLPKTGIFEEGISRLKQFLVGNTG